MAMYPDELEQLLQEYLTDGIITNAERQVLINKAISLNVDPNEFNLYITSQEQKLEQANKAAAAKLKGRQCPFCGGPINDFSDKCPSCGENITPQASEEVKEIIDNLEDALLQLKSGEDIRKHKAAVERYMRKAEMYYSSNPKIQKLLTDVKAESEAAEKAAKNRAVKKTLIDFVKNHKWLTAIIIFIVIGIISGICESISDAMADKTVIDSRACVEAMTKAVDEGDVTKAESLYEGFTKGKANLDKGTVKIVEYYIAQGEPDKAAIWVEKLDSDSQSTYEEKVADVYFANGQYEQGQKLIQNGNWVSLSRAPIYTKVIKAMRKNSESNADIKAYIEGIVVACDSEADRDALRKSLYTAADLK